MYIFGNTTAPAMPTPSSVKTGFALMTDLTRVLPAPASHPHAQFPGILMGVDEAIRKTDGPSAELLLNGSKPAPIAVFAGAFGSRCFAVLANPLDALLRADMEKQRRGKRLPMLFAAPDGDFARMTPDIPAWETALVDTAGRKEVDPKEWLASAEVMAQVIPPLLMAQNRDFARCRTFHAFFLVPDNEAHPLYDRVN